MDTSNERSKYQVSGRDWQVLHYQANKNPGVFMECLVAIVPVAVSIVALLSHSSIALNSPMLFFALLFLLSILSGTAAVAFAASRPTDILVSQYGLLAPAQFLMPMYLRRLRAWSDISRLEFIGRDLPAADHPRKLRLRFNSGGEIELELNGMRPSDLGQLLIMLKNNVPNLRSIPDLDLVKLDIPLLPADEPVSALTKLWQDELAERFSSTLFVPLAGGAYLQSGRYKVKSQLTFGGGSAIYLGADGNGTRIVIKEAVLPESVDAEAKAKALEMFDREAKLLMKLNDARVARLLDTFVERGRHYLVLEYIAGTDLRSYVKEQGPQCEAFVWNWARELADILSYLHSQNPPIVHRDVSPDNIIVRMDGSLALIDFGAANQLLGTATGTVVGKQAYIAPEQFRGHATVQSDIYGLGATLYFLSCGKDPLALSQSFPKESVPALSEEFDDLVANCTAVELDERFQNIQELKTFVEPAR